MQVTGITNATEISLGAAFACALLAGGTVDCWGASDFGALGTNVNDIARVHPA